MTGTIGWAIVIGLAALAQSPHRPRDLQGPAPSLDGSRSAPPSEGSSTPGDKAFSQLFTQPAPAQSLEQRDRRQPLEHQKPATKIVCGMVVIEADPSIDPKILVPPPIDSGTAKIRRIVPPACVE